MLKAIVFGLLILSLQARAADTCPASLDLLADIGQIKIDDRTDADFKTLENTQIREKFYLHSSREGCVYSNQSLHIEESVKTAQIYYLLLKKTTRGTRISLNGYTKKTTKLFEVRALVKTPIDQLSGQFDAGFFDASSAAREFLGKAQFEISLDPVPSN